MPRSVEYYFTPLSPWSYLGHDRLRAVCARYGATLHLRLTDYGQVFPVSGGLALKDRAPQRKAYRLVELRRWSRHLGIPLNLEPRHFPVPGLLAVTVIAATEAAHGRDVALDVAGDLMRATWAEERDVSDEDTVAALLGARGLDAPALITEAREPAAAARFAADTQRAIERGIFGAPTYVFRDEPFWGQDRLDFLDRALAGALAG